MEEGSQNVMSRRYAEKYMIMSKYHQNGKKELNSYPAIPAFYPKQPPLDSPSHPAGVQSRLSKCSSSLSVVMFRWVL